MDAVVEVGSYGAVILFLILLVHFESKSLRWMPAESKPAKPVPFRWPDNLRQLDMAFLRYHLWVAGYEGPEEVIDGEDSLVLLQVRD